MRRMLASALVCFIVSACAVKSTPTPIFERTPRNEEPKPQQEAKLELPAYPEDRDLIEFFPGPVGSHRYFIDEKSLTFGQDGIVRYTLVLRTTGGATNVTYEGIRCSSGERRLYAMGDRNKKWAEPKRSEWEPIRRGFHTEHHSVLYRDYLCPDRATLPDRASALRALRSGRRQSETRGDHL